MLALHKGEEDSLILVRAGEKRSDGFGKADCWPTGKKRDGDARRPQDGNPGEKGGGFGWGRSWGGPGMQGSRPFQRGFCRRERGKRRQIGGGSRAGAWEEGNQHPQQRQKPQDVTGSKGNPVFRQPSQRQHGGHSQSGNQGPAKQHNGHFSASSALSSRSRSCWLCWEEMLP